MNGYCKNGNFGKVSRFNEEFILMKTRIASLKQDIYLIAVDANFVASKVSAITSRR